MSIDRALCLSIIAGLAVSLLSTGCGRPNPPAAPLRLALPQADELLERGPLFGLALAPDGHRLVLSGRTDGAHQLWLHDLATASAVPLAGTNNGTFPFWAPDGTALAFFSAGRLRALTLADGALRDLAEAPVPGGGVWYPNGDILFAPDERGLVWRRSDGRIERFTRLENGESGHRHPARLDERHVVFHVTAPTRTGQGLWLAAIDGGSERKRLVGTDAAGLPVSGGLAYSSGGALVAQRLDIETGTLHSNPLLIGTNVGHGVAHQLFATVGGDVLIFGAPISRMRHLRWFDRSGNDAGLLGEPMEASDVRIAPRGATVAVTRVDPQLETLDIWAYDDRRPLPRRISSNIDVDASPVWSRDATRLAWVSGERVVTVRDARATRPDVSLRTFDNPVRVTDWSPDGKWFALSELHAQNRQDILLMSADTPAVTQIYVSSPFNESQASISPDGRWIAYVSDESGRSEIYVDSFPSPRDRARLTVGGGAEPRWSATGSDLFFRRGSGIHVMRLLEASGRLEAAETERLFDAGAEIRSFDVTSDGGRFLVNLPAPDSEAAPMSVIVNVSTALRALRPRQ